MSKENNKIIDFEKAPKEKFIVVGHLHFNRSLLHHGLDSLSEAKNYAKRISEGLIPFKSLIAKKGSDFNGIDVINDKGETPFTIGGPYGSFLLNS